MRGQIQYAKIIYEIEENFKEFQLVDAEGSYCWHLHKKKKTIKRSNEILKIILEIKTRSIKYIPCCCNRKRRRDTEEDVLTLP